MTKFGVYSEVGKLRKVIVHRPELSLQRLTPSNHDELLFDDVLWVERKQWDDANNTVAIEPGVVIAYERNTHTIAKMRASGVEVITIPGFELVKAAAVVTT